MGLAADSRSWPRYRSGPSAVECGGRHGRSRAVWNEPERIFESAVEKQDAVLLRRSILSAQGSFPLSGGTSGGIWNDRTRPVREHPMPRAFRGTRECLPLAMDSASVERS
jgi:hypothetical protein